MRAVSNIVAIIGLIGIAVASALFVTQYMFEKTQQETKGKVDLMHSLEVIQLNSSQVLMKGKVVNTGDVSINSIQFILMNNACSYNLNVTIRPSQSYDVEAVFNCQLPQDRQQIPLTIYANGMLVKTDYITIK
jgi:ABC-type Na+ efflux pump permease subunit